MKQDQPMNKVLILTDMIEHLIDKTVFIVSYNLYGFYQRYIYSIMLHLVSSLFVL